LREHGLSAGSTLINIRRARQDDAAGVQALLLHLGYESSEDDVRSKLALLSERTSDPVTIAVEDERPLGAIALHWTTMLHPAAPLARITALVVRDNARGTGVGRRLFDAGATLATNAGCGQLELTTALRRTDAQAFYRAIGFTESSIRLVRALPMVLTQSPPECDDDAGHKG
jgi:N-acetylglutamate synthase-like GNAT family acetyltransferase